jgi:hypothetical protein
MSELPSEETPAIPPDDDTSAEDTSPALAEPTPAPASAELAAASEPSYYDILGVPPTADAATIEAAYHSRSLRFRIGQLRERAREMAGPTQEEVERAFAVLRDPESRARYDAAYFPEQPPPPARTRRRIPIQVWIVAAIWLAVLAGISYVGFQLRAKPNESVISKIVSATAIGTSNAAGSTSTVVAFASPVATVSATTVPVTSTPAATPTTPLPTATATVPPTAMPSPTITPTQNPDLAIFRPTETPAAPGAPPATAAPVATPPPPTVPVPTSVPPTAPPPTATPAPPPPPPSPTPKPPPSFPATDRIGTTVPVNLRAGPGVNYVSQGGLPPGTLLAATGRSAYAGGYLWREFALADGRRGWVRDIDVLPAR